MAAIAYRSSSDLEGSSAPPISPAPVSTGASSMSLVSEFELTRILRALSVSILRGVLISIGSVGLISGCVGLISIGCVGIGFPVM